MCVFGGGGVGVNSGDNCIGSTLCVLSNFVAEDILKILFLFFFFIFWIQF